MLSRLGILTSGQQFPVRFASASAAVAQNKPLAPLQVSYDKSGPVYIAAVDNVTPVSKVSLFLRAGPRYEPYEMRGITHFLRHSAWISTKTISSIQLVRGLQTMGAKFTCMSTREHLIYSIECMRDYVPQALECLSAVSSESKFAEHELAEVVFSLKADLADYSENPGARVVEALHSAAYRSTPLSRSLYSPSYNATWLTYINDDHKHQLRECYFNPDMLRSFTRHNFAPANMAIVGSGVSLAYLKQAAEGFQTTGSKETPAKSAQAAAAAKQFRFDEPSKFYGGANGRIDTPDEDVRIVVAGEGVPLQRDNVKKLVAAALLQRVLGVDEVVSYVKQEQSVLNRAIASAEPLAGPASAAGFSVSYSDSALFGFQLTCNYLDAHRVLRAIASHISKAEISAEQLAAAKTQLRFQLYDQLSQRDPLLMELGTSGLVLGEYRGIDDKLAAIDQCTADDLMAVGRQAFGRSRTSMAAVGDLRNVLYADELFQ